MNLCICGGGNLGHVVLGVLAAQPQNRVSLLTNHPQRWADTVMVTDPNGKQYVGKIVQITNRAEDVIPHSDIVLLCLPGFAIREELEKIRPYLSATTAVGSIVSSTGFFFEAQRLLPKEQPLFGFQRVPFISRTTEYGRSAELKGYKPLLNLAIEQTANKEALRLTIEQLFQTPTQLLQSHYEASLTNSNPLLHPSRLYTLWKDWHEGIVYDKNPYFYADWTLEAAQLYIDMDAEFQTLLRTLPVRSEAIPDVLTYYESHDAASLAHKLRTIPAFQGILSPMKEVEGGFLPDFHSRYFTEDFPFGMRFIIELAQEKGVQIPKMKEVYEWGINRAD
jgi:NAD/NADP octopine/nopaline dehydrogenase, alpha-helical domain protein